MNLGFYVHSTSDTEQNTEIFNFLNSVAESKEVGDTSLFFNEVDFNPNPKKFGSFNSTELWSFSGVLLATTLTNVVLASKVVNDIKLAYLYNEESEKNNLMMLIGASRDTPVIVRNEEDKKEIYRLTGKWPYLMEQLDLQKIREVFNE